jgi:hypothetical protein
LSGRSAGRDGRTVTGFDKGEAMNSPQPARTEAPLSCQAVDRQAVRYFFNGLPRKRCRRIDAHLMSCPRCLRKLQVFERAWARGRKKVAGRSVCLPGRVSAPGD